jgi:hypothetical protein
MKQALLRTRPQFAHENTQGRMHKILFSSHHITSLSSKEHTRTSGVTKLLWPPRLIYIQKV